MLAGCASLVCVGGCPFLLDYICVLSLVNVVSVYVCVCVCLCGCEVVCLCEGRENLDMETPDNTQSELNTSDITEDDDKT